LSPEKSTDECKKIAKNIQNSVNSIVPVVIYYQKKPFVGNAVRESFEIVKGSHVIMASADLETDPYIMPQFIEIEKQYPDGIVTATRWKKGGDFKKYNPLKFILNFFFQKMISMLFFTKCSDLTYGYRIFPTELLRSIRWEEEKHPFFLETSLKPLRLGIRFTEIPVKWQARTEGESVNSILETFKYLKPVFHIRFMKKKNIKKCRND
jgi:hypothetical protein